MHILLFFIVSVSLFFSICTYLAIFSEVVKHANIVRSK